MLEQKWWRYFRYYSVLSCCPKSFKTARRYGMVTVNVKLEPTICRTGGEDANHVHVFQAFLTSDYNYCGHMLALNIVK